ncbi:pathogenesis-related protein 5-like [Anoplophora glabripennis]|uniref:pathogenesis-related protein 5-like n=1 Tax=Anoplophora glabripennis TaxID=217634 RepID=UPI000874A31E|nr:pathogenesis-related protein 5-like [Anoplophora glabripennis]
MLKVVLVVGFVAACQAAQFEIVNREGGPVWVGIQSNDGKPPLERGGFVLEKGQSRTVNSPDDWAGRFWARTWCDPNSKHCLTGDCGNKIECGGNGGAPPATLAEIKLKGHGGLDYYDISLVDGFNIPASIEPVGGAGDGGQYSCKRSACARHLNDACPGPLKLNTPNGVIGCKSACLAFNTDQYCCRGAHNRPETCRASDWPTNYPAYFKNACPDAYSYAYDDHKSTFTCKANKYRVTFGI